MFPKTKIKQNTSHFLNQIPLFPVTKNPKTKKSEVKGSLSKTCMFLKHAT